MVSLSMRAQSQLCAETITAIEQVLKLADRSDCVTFFTKIAWDRKGAVVKATRRDASPTLLIR